MAREHADFRVYLEQLNTYVPDRELLSQTEVMTIMGWASPTTIRRNALPMINGKVTKVSLARFMCTAGERRRKKCS